MYNTTKPYIPKILDLIKDCKKDIPASTDGIGTKGVYHWRQRTFRNAVLDALAMNLNDMAVIRAKATGLHNHIMIPQDDEEAILEIVDNLAEECRRRNILIYSGEIAIHEQDMKGMEISISISGKYMQQRKNKFELGDLLIGLKSSGLHSNGFTKVREIFRNEYRNEFVEPTVIYYDKILDLIKRFDIHRMTHITGGAYTKLKKFLEGIDIRIEKHNLKPQDIFYDLYNRRISDKEMYKTFNCGVGFILSVQRENSNEIIEYLKSDFEADIIGKIVSGNGKVKINSMFSEEEIEL